MSRRSILTEHGKMRLKERVLPEQNVNSFVRLVLRNGKNRSNYNGAFYLYLLSKTHGNKKIKVYEDNVYIFNRNTNKLVTTFPVPRKYLPLKKYEIPKRILSLTMFIKGNYGKEVAIIMKDGSELKGILNDDYIPEVISKIKIISDEQKKIILNIYDIKSINLDKKSINK